MVRTAVAALVAPPLFKDCTVLVYFVSVFASVVSQVTWTVETMQKVVSARQLSLPITITVISPV